MEYDNINSSKVGRAMKLAGAGAKVGGNYIKHYTKKMIGQATSEQELSQKNATLLFDTLGEMKGTVLKAAQMLSMEKNILPSAFVEKFAQAQYQVPPLSYPLVAQTFIKYFGKPPTAIFDDFSKQAVHAASLGQVHKAKKNNKALAVKVQYPGVAQSIESDMSLLKPIAAKILNANSEEIEAHFEEIKSVLIAEADYCKELLNAQDLSEACSSISGIQFPQYYPEWSNSKIITMDWIEALPLKVFLQQNPNQELKNKVGQHIWDFYQYQVHHLHRFHADPHPGNFLITPEGAVFVIDFGCVKVLSNDFYHSYMRLLDKDIIFNDAKLMLLLQEFKLIYADDIAVDKAYLFQFAKKTLAHITQPFFSDTFDFGADGFIENIIQQDEFYALKTKILTNRKVRGQKDALYLNRTYFGLFYILSELKAKIKTKGF